MPSMNRVANVGFADLIHPNFHNRQAVDGATIELDPVEDAALDVVIAMQDDLDAEGWASLAAMAREPRFVVALEALCLARAAEAVRRAS